MLENISKRYDSSFWNFDSHRKHGVNNSEKKVMIKEMVIERPSIISLQRLKIVKKNKQLAVIVGQPFNSQFI